MKLTREETQLLDEHANRNVSGLVSPDNITPIGELIFKIAAAARGIEVYTPFQWQALLDELDNEKRKVGEWADAML